jgi:hypothetical protein
LRKKHESPPAWVSGFFGSGKSHLVKMARALWANEPFADGRTPRDVKRLPASVADTLRELDTLARQRETKLRAAAGTLSQGEGDSIREAVLRLARDSFELGDKLAAQFPVSGDMTQDEFLAYFKEAVSGDGPMPLFLLVLDELQQYIADSPNRAMRVQEVIESLSKGFNGSVLIIATGQSALTGTPVLSKLLGRFPIQVQLSDSDVEEVLRETVLKKKASASQPLARLFSPSGCLGEIAAHLHGSAFAHRREDESLLGPSYPLLPTRQRLWERVLATTDASGTGVQLRSQLRLAFDAVRKSKDAPLGHIVGGDFICDEIRMRLRQSSQNSAETANAIDRLDGAKDERSRLKARALKAIFLLTRITNGIQDAGLHTDAQSVADVLIDDLTTPSAALRSQVSSVLAELAEKDRLLMRVSAGGIEEYRLQTRESADWFAYQRGEEVALRSDPSAYESKIREQLMQLAGDQVRKLAIPQGASREIRRLTLHTDNISAPKAENNVPVWLRSDLDGTQAKEVLNEAARAGLDSAIVFAHIALPRKDDLVRAIISREAAARTLDHFQDALARATGAAPRPDVVSTSRPGELLDELSATSGRDLVKRLAEEEKAASALLAALDAQASKVARRERLWQQLDTLLGHMQGLPEATALQVERDAIHDGRLLLDDPDKVEPLVNRAADALRAALNQSFGAYRSEYDQCSKEIDAATEWAKLAPEDRAAILREVQLSTPEATPKLGTLSELTNALAACSAQRWIEKRDALRGQLTRALNLAARKLEPKVQPITPPRRILRTEADLDAWLAEVRTAVIKKLPDGPVQL